MARPTKITVKKVANGDYEITCIDEMTGSATGMQIPENGYEVLEHHFRTGVMEISSDELIALPIPVVVNPVCHICDEPYWYNTKDGEYEKQCDC